MLITFSEIEGGSVVRTAGEGGPAGRRLKYFFKIGTIFLALMSPTTATVMFDGT